MLPIDLMSISGDHIVEVKSCREQLPHYDLTSRGAAILWHKFSTLVILVDQKPFLCKHAYYAYIDSCNDLWYLTVKRIRDVILKETPEMVWYDKIKDSEDIDDIGCPAMFIPSSLWIPGGKVKV